MNKTIYLLLWIFLMTPNLFGESVKKSQPVTLHLKNGSSIQAELVQEKPSQVIVLWQGGEIAFSRNEIKRIDSGSAHSDSEDGIVLAHHKDPALEWPYQNNPIVRLTNRQVLDASIKELRPSTLVLSQHLGDGAYAEQDIPLAKIENLEFKRVLTPESQATEEKLRTLFPKMRFHRLGMVTLVTDTEGAHLSTLKKIVLDQCRVFYLEYLPLVKGKSAQHQNFVVVFDDIRQYFEYAISDGVPAWLCPGYFSPIEKVLFLVNYAGDQFTSTLYQVVTSNRQFVDAQVKNLNQATGDHYDVQLKGIQKEAHVKIESAMQFIGGVFSDQTYVTLRHEMTHELFHNFGLQSILVSKIPEANQKLIENKKDLLQTNVIQKKKQLIKEILSARRKDSAESNIQIEASNSWFVEGLAEYSSTTAIGLPNTERLYELKETHKRGDLWPIEQLTVYKMGSFPGVSTKAMLSGYAQSWGFVSFLMKNYRLPFLKYIERMSKEKPTGNQDYVWLIEALGIDAKTLNQQWADHVTALESIEDPQIEQWIRLKEILDH